VAPEKGNAETLIRGLSGMEDLDAEIEVTLEEGAALRQIEDCHYDLLVVSADDVSEAGRARLLDRPDGTAIVSVGGPANGRARRSVQVPRPLSLTLLHRAVFRALNGVLDDRELRRRRLRDTAG